MLAWPLIVLFYVLGPCRGGYTVIKSKSSDVAFRYMDGIAGESEVRECGEREVCNVIHDRFWMPRLTERLCRCPSNVECSWEWTENGNLSVPLNNKSILKFCDPVTELRQCTRRDEAAVVEGEGDTSNSYLIPRNVTVHCDCPGSHYWRLQKYRYEPGNVVSQTFKCVKKRQCDTEEFCGHIRADLYSTYYRCTCPENHLCVFRNRTLTNVQELLYSGPAYKAYCYRLVKS